MKRTETKLMLPQPRGVRTVGGQIDRAIVESRVLGFQHLVFGEQVSAFLLQLVHLCRVQHFPASGWHGICFRRPR